MEHPLRGHRVEGVAKVTGTAKYVDDLRQQDLGWDGTVDVAVPVTSTQALGRLGEIDVSGALAVDGVRHVMTWRDAPRLRRVRAVSMAEIGELLPLQDDRVRYHGQCVAVVIAESLAAARAGAHQVQVHYDPTDATLASAFTLEDAEERLAPVGRAGIAPGRLSRGDAHADFERSQHRLDASFHAAPHHHNAIEPSAVIARWDEDGGVTVHAAVQWHHIDSLVVGQAFGLGHPSAAAGFLARAVVSAQPAGRVRLVNALAGGAFGRNLNPLHLLLACMAAKLTGRAVKVVLTREQTYTLLSYRGQVRQRVRLGASGDGRLTGMIVEPDVARGTAGAFVEPVGETPFQVYAHRSHALQHRVAALDLNGTGWMRGPGVSSAMFALETAMDDLARETDLDPLEIRLRNHADVNPQTGKPWSSKSLLACYDAAATAIGWRDRPAGGTVRADGQLLGHGMATSFDLGRQFPASARITLEPDGSATVSVAAAELGQGIFTALTTIAAESLGVPRAAIRLRTAGTAEAYAAGSIGSTGTFSNAAAIHEAAAQLRRRLFAGAARTRTSPLRGSDPRRMTLLDGVVHADSGASVPLATLLPFLSPQALTATGRAGRTFGRSRYAKASFGAVMVQVAVDPVTLVLSVERMVGVFACGRIVEPVPARSQVVGGMIWGLGQALFEESRVDRRDGRWVNANLAEALVPTQADVRHVEAHFVGEDDTAAHPLGMKGLAEIGVIGPAPAISNAVLDATGIRLRSLPMLVDHRLAAAAAPASLPDRHEVVVA